MAAKILCRSLVASPDPRRLGPGGRQTRVGDAAGLRHVQAASDEFVTRYPVDSVLGEFIGVHEVRNEPMETHRSTYRIQHRLRRRTLQGLLGLSDPLRVEVPRNAR